MSAATPTACFEAPATRPVRPVRALTALIVASAMAQAAILISSTAATLLFARAVGASWSGLPAAVGVGGVALGSFALTALMQAASRRSALITAYAAAAVGAGTGLLGVVAGPWLVLPGMLLLGMGSAGAQLSRYAGADLVSASRKGTALGAVVAAGSVGAVGGPALLAPTASVADLIGLPSLAGAFLMAAAATVTATVAVLVGGDFGATARQPTSGAGVRLPASPMIRVAVVGMAVAQVVMVALMTAAPLQMHQHGHGLGPVGIVISVHVLGMYGLAPLTGLLADRLGATRVLVTGIVVLAASATVMLQAHLTLAAFAVALFALGYGWNMAIVAASTQLARDLPVGARLRLQGLVEGWTWSASAAAALFSTPVFAAGGYQLLAAGCLVLVLAVVPLLRRAQAMARAAEGGPNHG